MNGESIREALEPVATNAKVLQQLAQELEGDEKDLMAEVHGDMAADLARCVRNSATASCTLSANGLWAHACGTEFAGYVDDFDTTVNSINIEHNTSVANAKKNPVIGADPEQLAATIAGIKSTCMAKWHSAEGTLDSNAATIEAKLQQPPSVEQVEAMMIAGLIPLSAAALFPGVSLTSYEQSQANEARVLVYVQRLRDEGVIGPNDVVDGLFETWVENAVERDVEVSTLVDIATQNDLDVTSFDFMDSWEEIKDPDGKSFFVLPEGVSADNAMRATWLTYVLNAGTDYGTADDASNPNDSSGTSNDFVETPYSADEVARIRARQDANSWSYTEDVGFVDFNGGRMVTAPNGMLMGVGGNWVQDMYSAKGGTTWGDIFMVNIDDAADPVAALRQMVQSGRANYVDEDDGHQFAGSLDLDRLLHHEERHSQQWQRFGYAGFLALYGSYQFDNFVLGWTGLMPDEDVFEEDAGLHDGGYK